MQRAEPPVAEAGFTLIEVLVAFVIAALLMTIVMPAALTASEREKSAEEKERAIRLVSQLVRERAAQPYGLEERKGRQNDLVWHTTETVVRNDPRGFLALTRIEAKVNDADGHLLFSAATRRLRRLAAQ
jgi:prepilin-type N-terminal cleavage/methylation domain-containing protein